jgi:hypothetical protein
MTYIVVENSGYEGERDVRKFPRYWPAREWVNKTYSEDEREEMHVEICKLTETGRTYEF